MKTTSIKHFIFADKTPAMNHYEVDAESPTEAIRLLVARHGQQPYRMVNVTPPAYVTEFPDYPAHTMPAEIVSALASGKLVDISWHNDGCPSFVTPEGNAQIDREGGIDNVPVLWVDYADPAKRSDPGACRFFVHAANANASCITEDVTEALAYLFGKVQA